MNPLTTWLRRWSACIVMAGLCCAPSARAFTSTLISTSNFSYNGSNSSRTYKVPSGANYVTIQAWGSVGYVEASYIASPNQSFTVTLSDGGSGGSTTVATPNGTITISGSTTCTASGSYFGLTTNANYKSGGPASPGAGNSSYTGYVSIQAEDGTCSLTVTAGPSGAGTVTGAGTYAIGTNVQIAASPWNGYQLSGWGGTDGLSVTSSGSNYYILMTQDRSVVANFTALVPVFTSSNAAQTLVVGKPFSFQVTATQSPVFSATSLPPGLAISSSGLISGTPTSAAVGAWTGVITASNQAISVQEDGVGAAEVVNLSSSTLGNNINAYAGVLDIAVNGLSTTGFCIDPWDSSAENTWLNYEWEQLANGPKEASGMGLTAALEIEQLWDEYFSASMSNSTAAGLQIAIWDLVDQSITAQNPGYTYSLNSSNNYGASTMLAWVEANPNAPTANLYAVTGNGQDYVTASSSLPQPITAASTATQQLPFFVYATPAVSSASATIPVNQPYGYQIAATGSPTTYSVSTLPAGLTLNTATGVISGTPTTKGTYTVTLTASNPGASGTGTLTLNIVQSYTLTITDSPGASAGTATGGGTYIAGATVQIQETPTSGWAAAGWSGTNVSAVASPSSGSTSIVMNGNYAITADFTPVTPVLTGRLPSVMLVGQAIATEVTATPASVVSVSNLPPGLTWSGSGTITSGTIGSAPTTVGAYTATISANNNGATASATTSTTVYPQLSLPTTSASTPENQPFTYSVGSPAWGSTLSATGLPTGLSFNPATGVISGTPTTTGTFAIALAEENPATSTTGTLTLTVTPSYLLTINSATGGTGSGGGYYSPGTVVVVSETAAAQYRTNGWGGPNANLLASPSSASTSIVMNGNYTLTPQFVQQATLTIASATGGSATGGGTYDVGTVVPVLATPTTGYAFSSWTGANIANASAASTTVTLTGNETITPAFGLAYTLSINAAPGGSTTGAGTYLAGSTVTVSETANSGYRTGGWGGPNASQLASAGSATTTIVMNGNYTLTPDFVQQAVLSITNVAGGTSTGGGTYDVGTVVPVTTTPNSGYTFTDWSGSNIANASATSTTVTLNASETITPVYAQLYTLSITGQQGGSATGAGTYAAGTTVTVTETPNAGYRTNGWAGPNASQLANAGSATTTIVMNGNYTISAGFVQQATLTITSVPGGTATGAGTYDVGTVVPIVATADSGYNFNGWGGSNIASNSSASTTVTLTGNETITPAFVEMFTLTIANATGGTATGAGSYPVGTTVTVSETPGSGYRTGGWTGPDAGQLANAASATTTVVMNGNYSVTPDFVQQATLTIAASAGGTATGGGTYDVGTVVPVVATPNSGYGFTGWSGAGLASQSSASTTVTLTSSETITPSFAQMFTLTIDSATGGTATGAGTYTAGTIVTIAETANTGYRDGGWAGPNESAVANSSAATTTIVMNGNYEIAPDFVQQGILTIATATGGTATGAGTYDVGTVVPIVATPSSSWTFTGWSGAGIASPSSADTTITITGDETITPSFTAFPTVTITAPATAYSLSPLYVSSTATTPADNLTLHSIEWLSPTGTWSMTTQNASGGTDNYTYGITFPTSGVWTVRAAASTDGGNTWYYSPTQQITVSNGITSYTFETMAVPPANMTNWYNVSPVAQKVYQVQHTNPAPSP